MSTTALVAWLPGDGIGPEVAQAAREVLDVVLQRCSLVANHDVIPCGGKYYLRHGQDWPSDGAERCARADVMFLGAVGYPSPTGSGPVTRGDGRMAGYSAVLGNRQKFDLFANIRPVRLWPGLSRRITGRLRSVWSPEDVNLEIIRENTEGLYIEAGATLRSGGSPVGQVAVDTRVVTRAASMRICEVAFQRASRSVTAVVKHNLLEGCRLFVDTFKEVSLRYPHIEANVTLVDAFAPDLIQSPEKYDVVVTTNLFGDILTDLAAVLQGGMGMAIGGNIGLSHAMFEPIHGSAPDIAGQGKANPLAMILSVAEGLRWLSLQKGSPWREAAERIERAVGHIISQGPLTADLVGSAGGASTAEVTEALVDVIRRVE
ncbi:MAG: isocitrate/isopropylmalate dehydrogenase family protein [Myxococcales bacterium]|nr:isocitrate/isopropylmalate dehydrogenase family protein [Myxococcales bacterium]